MEEAENLAIPSRHRRPQARERWIAAREQELLTTVYFHVVFTVPHELNVLALDNQRRFYDLLFNAKRCHAARSGSQSRTSRRRDWNHQHAAHMGTESAS